MPYAMQQASEGVRELPAIAAPAFPDDTEEEEDPQGAELPLSVLADAVSAPAGSEISESPLPGDANVRPRLAVSADEYNWLVKQFQELAASGERVAIDKLTLTSIMERGQRSIPPNLSAHIDLEKVRSAHRRWREASRGVRSRRQ